MDEDQAGAFRIAQHPLDLLELFLPQMAAFLAGDVGVDQDQGPFADLPQREVGHGRGPQQGIHQIQAVMIAGDGETGQSGIRQHAREIRIALRAPVVDQIPSQD